MRSGRWWAMIWVAAAFPAAAQVQTFLPGTAPAPDTSYAGTVTVSKKDYMQSMEQTFDSLDLNHDGLLSQEELYGNYQNVPAAPPPKPHAPNRQIRSR